MNAPSTEDELQFREYQPGDLDGCTRLAWEAWAADSVEPAEGVEPRVMEGYVRSFLARSNWKVVISNSEGVIGLLFGRIGGSKAKGGGGSSANALGMIPQFLFGVNGYHVSPMVLVHFFLTEFKVLVNVPRSDAEINLIIVDSRHRGKGLGKKLMDRFMAAAREAGCRLATLYTDDQVSNWKFYEIYGFRKVGTFHDSLTSYFAEAKATGIVYALDLK
jgi:ribosomal protein S18 acetylase RimI-like enzyme